MANILLLDDDNTVLYALKEGLINSGFTVFSTSNADEAVAIAKQESINLALFDYCLDGETGLEVIEKITEFKYLPFVIITSSDDEDVIIGAGKMGALGFITKPINIDSLIPQIKIAIIRGKHYYRLEVDTENTRIINIAVGIIVSRLNINPDKARSMLNIMSRNERMKLKDMAENIVRDYDNDSSQDTISKFLMNRS